VLDQGSALHNCLAGRPLGLRGVEVPLKAESSMTWSRAFPEPFVLADGRKIKTVYEAGQPCWPFREGIGRTATGKARSNA